MGDPAHRGRGNAVASGTRRSDPVVSL
jgi:hypothetical protein